jgi:hypothetical protein
LRCSAVSPPPSGYRMPPGYQPRRTPSPGPTKTQTLRRRSQ